MKNLYKYTEVIELIKKECWRDSELVVSIVEDYYANHFGIIYLNEKGEQYTNDNFIGYIKRVAKKQHCIQNIWLPSFQFHEVEDMPRFVIENGEMVDYETSAWLAEKMNHPQKKRVAISPEEKAKCKALKLTAEKNKFDNVSGKEVSIFKEAFATQKSLLSFDLEWHEKNHSLLEIGVSLYQDGKFTNTHILIEENIDFVNGDHVPNHKQNFMFGTSEMVKEDEAIAWLISMVEKVDYCVGHSLHNDLNYLKMSLPRNKYFDLVDMANPFDYGLTRKMSLGRILERLEMESQFLHNGGNDAYYTLQCMIRLAKV